MQTIPLGLAFNYGSLIEFTALQRKRAVSISSLLCHSRLFLVLNSEEDKARWIAVLSQVSGVDVSELNRAAKAVSAAASGARTDSPGKRGGAAAGGSFEPPKRTKEASRFQEAEPDPRKSAEPTAKPVARRLGNSRKASAEVGTLETPTDLVSQASPLELDADEKRKNAEAIKQAKIRREQYQSGAPKTRQEELRERLLDDDAGSDDDDAPRDQGPLQKCNCAGCSIL